MSEEALNNENNATSEVVPAVENNETTAEPSYTESLNELRSSFEKKLESMKADYDAKLKERDNIINQLLTEEKTEIDDVPDTTIIDRINERRKRSKF